MKKKRFDFSLVLPCYNEEPVFADSVALIKRILSGSSLTWEIIFVDDGSRDDTRRLIAEEVTIDSHCRAIYHAKNKGRGASVADGILIANGTTVGYIDIDCEVSPVYIPDIVRLIASGRADMIVGERIYRVGMAALVRLILSVGYRKLITRLVPTYGIDTESGFKFFNRKKILPILSTCRDPHWFWDTEIVVRAGLAGMIIQAYPVLFTRRTDKVSSVRIIPDTIAYLKNIRRFSQEITSSK